MTDYDFKSLSPYDFEVLVKDLLTEKLSVSLDSYKPGKDQGIDLRGYSSQDETIIVQCKHYASSTFSDLKSSFKGEISKVEKLKPDRYYLATSLSLLPKEQTTLYNMLPNYFENCHAIFHNSSLNDLLKEHPRIHKNHFKLWLSSTEILKIILNNGIHNRSEASIEAIREKIKLYVHNDSYNNALEVLEKYRYLIISGVPGIGKTTLAQILAYQFMNEGFEFIEITTNVKEGWNVYNKEKKQIFYYDDFLGSNILSTLEKNEEKSILKFIKTIHQSDNHFFILTTREYILQQSKLTHDAINNTEFDIAKCVIALSDYTVLIRAKILYNHIYFSKISNIHKNLLVENKFYMKILDHKNFNPRLIDMMLNDIRIKDIDSSKYLQEFEENLNNPERIWRHPYEQLAEAPKKLLTLMLTMQLPISLNELKELFLSIAGSKTSDFSQSIKILDDSFIKTTKDKDILLVNYYNPSVEDFLLNHLESMDDTIVEVINSSQDITQLSVLLEKQLTLKQRHETSIVKKAYLEAIERLLLKPERELHQRSYYRFSFEKRALLLLRLVEFLNIDDINNLLLELVDALTIENYTDENLLIEFLVKLKASNIVEEPTFQRFINKIYTLFAEAIEHSPNAETFEAIGNYIEHFSSYLKNSAIETLRCLAKQYDFDSELDDYSTVEELEWYFATVENICISFDLNIEANTSSISDKLSEGIEEEEIRNIERSSDRWKEWEKPENHDQTTVPTAKNIETEIDLMFASFK